MRRGLGLASVVVATVGLIVMSCAPYKQLQPKPEITPAEGDFIPLKRGDKDFELKADKQYYIAFPPPPEDNFYLVLNMPDKKRVTSYLTASLVDEKKPGEKITDESPYPDTQSAYPIDPGTTYYWIVEKVPADLVYRMDYRYVPRWRFKFETRHTTLKETYAANKVDRETYRAIAPGFDVEKVDFALAIDTIGKHTEKLETVLKELQEIESLFPQKLLNSDDEAYKAYVSLKKSLEDEIAFQKNYAATLNFFYQEQQTRKSAGEFVGRVDVFTTFLKNKDKLPSGVVQLAQQVMKRRLAEVVPFYDERLRKKDDAKPFNPDFFRYESYIKLPALYDAAGVAKPADFQAQLRFMTDYQTRAHKVIALRDSLEQLGKAVEKLPPLPLNDAFNSIASRAEALRGQLPRPIDEAHAKYQNLPCSVQLNKAINAINGDVTRRAEQYQLAGSVVSQVNALRTDRNYSAMLGILVQHKQLGFLMDKYAQLDTMAVNEQARTVRAALQSAAWAPAENALRELHAQAHFIDPQTHAYKEAAVRRLEDSLYLRVERVTRARVMKFLEERISQLTDIDSLYTDSAFLPVHDISFTSGGRRELVQRKEKLIADLARMKENEFPKKAVKLLFDQFIKNPSDSGVYRARAMVAHGKHYKGDDKQTKRRIAECNPWLAKWIVKPKEYRRLFALPITTNEGRGRSNQYMFRLNVRIKTEAKFPVYDVNVKLPKWLVKNASAKKWYDSMKLNKKLLKNEGRFSIGAPTAANDYECQVTPVQMDKDGNNIFEVKFTAPGFKVIPVSVMVQKPLIKKN